MCWTFVCHFFFLSSTPDQARSTKMFLSWRLNICKHLPSNVKIALRVLNLYSFFLSQMLGWRRPLIFFCDFSQLRKNIQLRFMISSSQLTFSSPYSFLKPLPNTEWKVSEKCLKECVSFDGKGGEKWEQQFIVTLVLAEIGNDFHNFLGDVRNLLQILSETSDFNISAHCHF